MLLAFHYQDLETRKVTFRLATLAGAIAVAFPLFAHADELYLLAAPRTSSEKTYNRVHKQVKSDLVHARGYHGKGAIVAVLDTGVRGTHNELKNELVSTTRMFDASTGTYVTPTDGHGHGTHVAGIVGGSTGNGKSYGIAPDAKILPIKVFSSSTWTASSAALASGLRVATATPGVSVINLSLGATGSLGSGFETELRNTINADKLVVVAAGNSGGANPQWPARYAKETWAKGQIIAVGAVDSKNVIASFSNRAGDTANWFIVAPGTSVLNAGNSSNTSYVYMNGTSMAAPIVAGAAALLEGAWPHLKAGEVASILFQTATDLGAPGIDAVYGWGLLNVDRAMEPVGTLTVPLSGSSTQLTASSATLSTSTASWSGLRAAANAGQLRGITVDGFNRDFSTDYGAGIRAPARERIADTLAMAGRSLQVSERVTANGSRFMTAVEEQRPSSHFAHDGAARTLLASSAVFKLAGGHELAFATGRLAGSYFGLAETDAALANPYLGLAQSGAQMAMGFNHGALSVKAGVLDGGLNAAMARQHVAGEVSAGRAAITELNYALGGKAVVGMQFADVSEGESYLGALGGAAMALEQGRTRTLTAHAAYRLAADVTLAAQYSAGRTADASGEGLFAAARGVRSEAFALGLVGRNALIKDDRLAFTVSSPLRIAAGTAEVIMPVALTEAGEAVFDARRVSLASTSRETRFGLDYAMPVSAASSLSWVAAMRHNANHVDGEREAQVGVMFRTAF